MQKKHYIRSISPPTRSGPCSGKVKWLGSAGLTVKADGDLSAFGARFSSIGVLVGAISVNVAKEERPVEIFKIVYLTVFGRRGSAFKVDPDCSVLVAFEGAASPGG